MQRVNPLARWLEQRLVSPAYAGMLLTALALCFFGAATNTLAGWLYVISGVIAAMLMIAAVLPPRSLRSIQIKRYPIEPVSAGDVLRVELAIVNHLDVPKTLLQIRDCLPLKLGQPVDQVIESLPAQETYHWVYDQPTEKRGIYRWQDVQLRTATPLGLFWCRRDRLAKATAIVYPTVLPLSRCPLVDAMGQEINPQFQSNQRSQTATEGLTRALRPYRWGDPTRLVHWRTSARYGELRVRELEIFTGGQEILIALDSGATWQSEDFEQAVVAAASLYFYALNHSFSVRLWTAGSGLLHGETPVSSNAGRMTWQSSHAALETLAATIAGEDAVEASPQGVPMIWITPNPESLNSLSEGNRWLLWDAGNQARLVQMPGIVVNSGQSLNDLQQQLQQPLLSPVA